MTLDDLGGDNNLDDMAILEGDDSKDNDEQDTKLDKEGDSDLPRSESGEGDSEEDGDGEEDEPVEDENSDEEESEEDSETEEEEEKKGEDSEESAETKSLFKKVKEAAPDIFKKVPELRTILGQHKQYSDVFPSVEDAKAALEDVRNFEEIREAALSGKPGNILDELHRADKNAALKFAENFLPDVLKRSPQLYANLTAPILARVLRNVQESAKKSKNKNLYLSTKYLSEEIFESADIPEFDKKDPAIEAKEKELEAKNQEIQQGVYDRFKKDTFSEAYDRAMLLIREGLDPNKVMSKRMAEAAAKDVFLEVEKIVKSDPKFRAQVDALWKAAKQNGYGREASNKIIHAYLARVKPLLPGVRHKVRVDYLGKQANQSKPVGQTKKHIPQAGNSDKKGGPIDPRKVDFRHSSDEDIMKGRIRTK
jgi:hypothetical protein